MMCEVDKDLEKLKCEVINGKNQVFLVNSIETSRGKTTGTASAIADYFENDKGKLFIADTRFVFVSKFAEECAKIAKSINEKVNANVALAYTRKAEVLEAQQYKEHCTNNYEKCIEKSVIVITHAMYIKLCGSENVIHVKFKEAIKQNFTTLIIDEQIDNVDDSFVEFNNYKFELIKTLFIETQNKQLNMKWSAIAKPLLKLIQNRINWINASKNNAKYKNQMHKIDVIEDNFISLAEEELSAAVNYLREKLESIDNQLLKDLNREKIVKIDKDTALEIINTVELMHREALNGNLILSLSNNGNRNLYTYDSSFEFLKLKNNIWLDASSKFHSLYLLNKEFFNVVDTERIIDHSECNLNIDYNNTSTSSKKKDLTKFRTDIYEYIKEKAPIDQEHNKVLVLTNDKECKALKEDFFTAEEIEEYNIEFTNFKNMKGKNDWEDYNYCFIIQTPRMSFAYYVFLYEYWTNKHLTDDEMFISTGKRYQCQFKHGELTKLMEDEITSYFYQAMKRIARNKKPKGNFFIMSNVYNSIDIVKLQLNNIIPIESGKKKFKIDCVADLIKDLKAGIYDNEKWEYKNKNVKIVQKYKSNLKIKLRWICNVLSIRDVSELNTRLLGKMDLKELRCYIKDKELIIKI
ncbi:hypothetical protein [Clostridium sp.]|uniref:hypothetical protein n=1 Tax=Clostridium sp. TaxID=1506 RepID=UPI001A541882|nr:hypothetical protein [Clostridium sp.]MBK5242070.1 hypothetical protein [Clostridium sp.]